MPTNPDATAELACLFTTVRNISGHERVFGYLGPHGKRLASYQQYTVRGSLADQVAKSKRKFEALERDLAAENLVLISTPSPVIFDWGRDHPRTLTVHNGTLGIEDPCWGSYSSTA